MALKLQRLLKAVALLDVVRLPAVRVLAVMVSGLLKAEGAKGAEVRSVPLNDNVS
jgi:hypothetical protein